MVHIIFFGNCIMSFSLLYTKRHCARKITTSTDYGKWLIVSAEVVTQLIFTEFSIKLLFVLGVIFAEQAHQVGVL